MRGVGAQPSEIQDQLQSLLNRIHELGRDLPGWFSQVGLIEGDHLGHHRYGVLRKLGGPLWEEDVPGCVLEAHVGAQGHGQHRVQAAAVEAVGLDDEHWAAVSGL